MTAHPMQATANSANRNRFNRSEIMRRSITAIVQKLLRLKTRPPHLRTSNAAPSGDGAAFRERRGESPFPSSSISARAFERGDRADPFGRNANRGAVAVGADRRRDLLVHGG